MSEHMKRFGMMLFSGACIAAMMVCGLMIHKNLTEKQNNKETSANIIKESTTKRVEIDPENVDLYNYFDNLDVLASTYKIPELSLQGESNYTKIWENNDISLKNKKGTYEQIEKYKYPLFDITVKNDKRVGILGYRIGEEISYYMDQNFKVKGFSVEKDGRLKKHRYVTFVKLTADRAIFIELKAVNSKKKIDYIHIYAKGNGSKPSKAEKRLRRKVCKGFIKAIRNELERYPDDHISSKISTIGDYYRLSMIVWHPGYNNEMTLYYMSKKLKLKKLRFKDSISYDITGEIAICEENVLDNYYKYYKYSCGRMKNRGQGQAIGTIKDDQLTYSHFWGTKKISEKEFKKKQSERISKSCVYIHKQSDAGEYSGNNTGSEMIERLEKSMP
ncbi:MAG: hypothetical protein IJF94_04195 [Eubacterium sp.]|nr:hypothetical protein [Eubacterium sp.]